MNSVKTILISQVPLPYHGIGSWTNMYNYYLNQKEHQIDYVICPTSESPIQTVVYEKLREVTVFDKLKNKIKEGNRFANYIETLQNIIQPDEKYIIQIIDNLGVILPIHNYLSKSLDRSNCFIQYFYHGFSPLINNKHINEYATAINEMVFLTKLSYQEHLSNYNEFTLKSTILANGVDTNLFFRADEVQKQHLKQEFKLQDKLVFIWCSQDRPKKGLDLILNVWKHIYKKHGDKITLLIVGVKREIEQKGVINIGRVPNIDLPKYYQMSDVYLFPSLWKEGFGIVLAEALNSGCYCIASAQGGIPEVLQYGKMGLLVEFPNNINSWVEAIEQSIEEFKTHDGKNKFIPNVPNNIYSLSKWSTQMNRIIDEAKFSLIN